MSSARIQKRRRQQGLTLIELVVVLTILVALGGLLVPVIGNALTRSHVATCASNIPEIYKMLVTAEATRGEFGDGWTTGVFGAGAGAGEPVNNSAANTLGGGGGTGDLDVDTLSADEIAALAELGIVNVFNHGDPTASDYDITFNAGLTSEALATTTEVIVLTDTQAGEVYLQTGGSEKYIWLGIDKSWEFLGELAQEPPVHFGDADGAFPNQAYSRFGAIFQVTDAAGDALPVAEMKRVTYCLDGDAFETGDNHIGIHWNEVQD